MKVIKENNQGFRFHRICEEAGNMKKFDFEFSVDGVKSTQSVNAVSMQKAQELIQKQYNGQQIVFTKKQEVQPQQTEDFEDEHIGASHRHNETVTCEWCGRNVPKCDIVCSDEFGNLCRDCTDDLDLHDVRQDLDNETNEGLELNELDELSKEDLFNKEPAADFSDLDDEFSNTDGEVSGPELGKDTGIAMQLNALIRDEWEAIDGYTSTIATIGNDPKYADIVKVLQSISNEEHAHVGELQEVLKTISPNVSEIESGKQEAQDTIDNADADGEYDDDIFAESIHPTVQNKPLQEEVAPQIQQPQVTPCVFKKSFAPLQVESSLYTFKDNSSQMSPSIPTMAKGNGLPTAPLGQGAQPTQRTVNGVPDGNLIDEEVSIACTDDDFSM